MLVDLVQPLMKSRRPDVTVAKLAKRDSLRLAVDGYFIFGSFIGILAFGTFTGTRFIDGGVGFGVNFASIGCLVIAGWGGGIPTIILGVLNGLPFCPLVNPTICNILLALAKAGIIAAVARVTRLRITLDHTNREKRLRSLRSLSESPARIARHRRARRSFVLGLCRIDRSLKQCSRRIYTFRHHRLFLNATL
jgi:hypothetical protein